MFSKAIKSDEARLRIAVYSRNAALAARITSAIESSGRYQGEVVNTGLSRMEPKRASANADLHVVDAEPSDPEQLGALKRHMDARPSGMPVIVVSRGLAENCARQFLKLGVSDWLPADSSNDELLAACDHALRPRNGGGAQARCIAFMSAVGGAGATTLALAAVLSLANKSRESLGRSCLIDLDFQHSTLAEYADVVPTLQLNELSASIKRLDRHLLEIMLTRHAPSGLAILSAPPSLMGAGSANTETIGRILDVAASDFGQLVLDLPTCWQPWCRDIVRGVDAIFIVTPTSVTGLRQARRLAEMVHSQCGIDMSGTVIVNRSRRFFANVSRKQAREALGPLLAGFIPDVGNEVTRSQDRGAAIATLPRNPIARGIFDLIAERQKTTDIAEKAGGFHRK
jgi:pilus assembly protein CpaE